MREFDTSRIFIPAYVQQQVFALFCFSFCLFARAVDLCISGCCLHLLRQFSQFASLSANFVVVLNYFWAIMIRVDCKTLTTTVLYLQILPHGLCWHLSPWSWLKSLRLFFQRGSDLGGAHRFKASLSDTHTTVCLSLPLPLCSNHRVVVVTLSPPSLLWRRYISVDNLSFSRTGRMKAGLLGVWNSGPPCSLLWPQRRDGHHTSSC